MFRPGIQRRGSAGFTLLELTVVIALLAILTALIIPEMRGSYGDAVLRAGSRDLANVCAIASSQAVSFNRLHRVRLDSATGRFRIEKKGPGSGGESGFVPVRDVAGADGSIDTRVKVRIQGANEPMDFPEIADGSGSATGGSAVSAPAPAAEAGIPGDSEAPPIPAQAVSFYPDGTADPVIIVLRDADGFGLALRVNPATSRVRITELKHR